MIGLWDWLRERPYWELTATVAVAAAVAFVVLRSAARRAGPQAGPRVRRGAAFAGDLAIAATVFAVYQHSVHLAHTRVDGAVEHALTVVRIEDALRLPSELDVQQLVLPHPLLVQALNGYYGGVHLPLTIGFVLWVLWARREAYPAVRNVVAISTLVCVLIQTIPVAPPRLMPQLGFVDTAIAYGQSVYGPGGGGVAGQLAAMPSIHVAWAVIVAYYGLRLIKSAWRWVLVAHCAATVLVVTATANHWWLDGIVAAGIVAATIAVQELLDRRAAARRAARETPASAPEEAAAVGS